MSSVLEGLSVPERIVHLFKFHATEAHRSAIERPLNLRPEQFDRAISEARDLGVEEDPLLRITAIYDREGWWTCRPTHRIAALYIQESNKRHRGEATRNARVYRGFGPTGRIGEIAAMVAMGEAGMATSITTSLPELEISDGADFIVAEVDQAIAAGRGYVARMAQEQLAA